MPPNSSAGRDRGGQVPADGLGDLADGHALFLRVVFGVSSSSQLACRCGDPDLEVGCWRQAECVAVDFRALWSGCRARRGVLDQCEAVWSWARCGACKQFSEIMGSRHACSQVTRVPGAGGPGEQAAVPLGLVERVRGEAQQDRLDDRGVVEDCRLYRARLGPR
jgi:hypothetical protein